MNYMHGKYFPYLLLGILCVPLFFLNIRDVHYNWGDDFAQYIKEAQNIATGRPFYQSGYIYNRFNIDYAPPQYPAGFPLLLAPVVKIWGIAIRPMLYFMTIIATALLLVLFEYFKKYTSVTVSICLSVAILYSGYMLDMKGNILSDVPCLLFTVLYLLVRNVPVFSWQRILLLVLLAAMAILIRSQAVLLLAVEGVYLVMAMLREVVRRKRLSVALLYKLPSLYVIGIVPVLLYLLNKTVFYAPISTSGFYDQFVVQLYHSNLLKVIGSHMSRLLTNSSIFFGYNADNDFLKVFISFIQSVGVVFSVVGFAICVSRRLSFDDIFSVCMCLLLVLLPVHDFRYFMPVVPLLFFYCYTTIRTLLPAIAKVNGQLVAILLTVVYLGTGYTHLRKAARDIPGGAMPQHNDLVAFDYISRYVNDTDVIIFTKPRALTLFTGKRAVNTAWQVSMDDNKRFFDSLHVKYVLITAGLDNWLSIAYLREEVHPTDSVNIAVGYTLYTIR